MPEFIKITREGHLTLVTFARAQGLNILSSAVLTELGEAWTFFEKDGQTRVVLFSGEGKVFLAGADIKEMAALHPQGALDLATKGQQLFQRIEHSPIISIAALHGAALGGGCELAIACDIRVASDDLKIGLPEVNLGLVPGFGGTQRLPRLIGMSRALRMILSGEPILAAQALQYGLVTEVVPGDQLLPTAKKIAETILAKGPQAVAMAKQLIHTALQGNHEVGFDKERKNFYKAFQTGEGGEGLKAFLEKRPANFEKRQPEYKAGSSVNLRIIQ